MNKILILLFLNIGYCQSDSIRNTHRTIQLQYPHYEGSAKNTEINNFLESVQIDTDTLNNNILKLIDLVNEANINGNSLYRLLIKLDNLNNPLVNNFICNNIFYKTNSEEKIRSWDNREFPYFITILKSDNIDYYKLLIINSKILSDCNLSDSQLNLINDILNSGYVRINLKLMLKNLNATETCRINNFKKLIAL
ncbi:MAG: hypothetical protein ABI851_09210 [Saprospiraceae bacterium]